MTRFIAILLASSLAFATNAIAKPNDKKAAPKSRPAPVQKQQHVNAGPKVQHHVNAPKVHASTGPKHNELRKTTTVHPKKVPPVSKQLSTNPKPNKAPKLETPKGPGPTNVVADEKLRKNVKTKVLPKETIARIRAQHTNFKANPNPKIASVQFNQNYQIAGAQNWSGPQYQVFASYRPQWHDRGWWQTNFGAHLTLIAGGWYYWDAGYWYPAWGYDESAAYYPYDGPIYVGDNARPFDQVVADCQATLQEEGYYHGEVDGLMGPLTRQALADFQRDHGLITTAALDEPTLSSLGLG